MDLVVWLSLIHLHKPNPHEVAQLGLSLIPILAEWKNVTPAYFDFAIRGWPEMSGSGGRRRIISSGT
ncbi:MAG TPA: hypothetical protein VNG94_02270, partial [Pyrinomonadaceae bacterium]|nr:hypothetical protein [Pyrinomonadaceae bacterium]